MEPSAVLEKGEAAASELHVATLDVGDALTFGHRMVAETGFGRGGLGDGFEFAIAQCREDAAIGRVRAPHEHHPLLIVVFARGWKHNAPAVDSNVSAFADRLRFIAREDEGSARGGHVRIDT